MSSLPTSKTAALTVPILPHTCPQAAQPKGLRLPLFPHQLRALHRCLLVETDGSLSRDFHHLHQYKSKGGVLADAVGTGKTATMLGLVLEGHSSKEEGDTTLVVAPAHLIPQWKHEIQKFAGDAIQVLVGKHEYQELATIPPPTSTTRRIVLVDVDTILQETKVWYNFRRVYDSSKGAQLKISPQDLEKYRQAAMACVKSPRGPCSYDGWVYTGILHHPYKPWRRVIFDEIQDLVSQGTSSQKNLLQLSRDAPHVWLLSATPFPHGNKSVYANHELLGFCRLRLDVEVSRPLPSHHVFEKIKRKLYIKSPRHVADEAVAATKMVIQNKETVKQMEVEKQFYEMELCRISESTSFAKNVFGDLYSSLREMTVHPEASAELRQQALGDGENGKRVGQFSSVSSFANVSLKRAKQRQVELRHAIKITKGQLGATERSLELAGQIKNLREAPVTSNPFAGPTLSLDTEDRAKLEEKKIHDFFCTCNKLGGIRCRADKQVYFRTIGNDEFSGPEFIRGYRATKQVVHFFQSYCNPTRKVNRGTFSVDALDHYITCTTQSCSSREQALKEMEKELDTVCTRVKLLTGSTNATNSDREKDLLASMHGSKPAALVRYLRNVVQDKGERAIVFSYWHDTLKLVQRTLTKSRLPSAFCDGHSTSKALVDFTSGAVSILLLSAQAKASGANLQCATQVILLDPAGSSAEHGAALEQQAVGRAVRMGQDKPVTVTRFCVEGTLEEQLFDEIDKAASQANQRAKDSDYVCEGAHTALPPKPKSKPKEANDVQVTESVSAKERIERQFGEAKEKGMIIDLFDSDDEEGTNENVAIALKKSPVACVSKQEAVVVKKEPTPTKEETATNESPAEEETTVNSKRLVSDIESSQDDANSECSSEAKRLRIAPELWSNNTAPTSPHGLNNTHVEIKAVTPEVNSKGESSTKAVTSVV